MALGRWDVEMLQKVGYSVVRKQAMEWEQRKTYETFDGVVIDYESWGQIFENESRTTDKISY